MYLSFYLIQNMYGEFRYYDLRANNHSLNVLVGELDKKKGRMGCPWKHPCIYVLIMIFSPKIGLKMEYCDAPKLVFVTMSFPAFP